MPDHFYSETPITGEVAQLGGAEAHHLAHVLRAKVGDIVTLFDGTGCEFSARVEVIDRSRVDLTVLSRRQVSRELPIRVTLGVSLPKGDRQRWLIEKATELGVARLAPLVTKRGVAQPTENAISRLRRTVIEASKQCGRSRLMEIAEPQRWCDFAAAAPAELTRFIAHPRQEGHSPVPPAVELCGGDTAEIMFAIGPEGGFTDDEFHAALQAGWRPIDLGPRILRVETAALVLACMAVFGCMEASR